MQIVYHPKFVREYKKLPDKVKSTAEKKEKIFRVNPFDKRLKTHKLHGELVDYYSFSIDHKYRIVFDFLDRKTVRFYSVGLHDIYK